MNCDICNRELTKTTTNRAYGKILCCKHYQQMLKFGHVLDTNPRFVRDLNEFEIIDDYVKIFTYNKRGERTGSFLIDVSDMENVLKRKWRLWKGRFFTGNNNPMSITAFLLNPPFGSVVDHINGDPSDNRRKNLRITTQGNNLINKGIQNNNSSGIAGVSWNEKRKKYEVEIRRDKKRIKLSRYKNFCDAVYVRYVAEKLLFKEFRSNRNDDLILKIIESCENKQELYKYTENKILQLFNI